MFRGRGQQQRAARVACVAETMSAASGFGKALVIITGASKGFGRALALSIAPRLASGSALILAARSDDLLQQLETDLSRAHPALTLRCVAADLSCQAGVESVIAAITHTHPGIDRLLLFNNAGETFAFSFPVLHQ